MVQSEDCGKDLPSVQALITKQVCWMFFHFSFYLNLMVCFFNVRIFLI